MRATTLLRCCALLLAAGAAACVDLAEPNIPDRRMPASAVLNVRAFDTGVLQVDGSLSPGRDSLGFQRAVPSPFVQAAGQTVEPRTVSAQGLRTYSSVLALPGGRTAGPFDVTLPVVSDVGMLPPARLYGLRRLDPDTLIVPRGGDIVLHMDTVPAASDPPNRFRQWFLDVRAGNGSFRVSGDGPVPLRIRIPFEWVPPAPDQRASVTLIYYQTAQLRSPGGLYSASLTLDTRLQWWVRFTSEQGAP
jgi:hypothetical protein